LREPRTGIARKADVFVISANGELCAIRDVVDDQRDAATQLRAQHR